MVQGVPIHPFIHPNGMVYCFLRRGGVPVTPGWCPHVHTSRAFVLRLRGPKSVGVGAPAWPLSNSGFAGETLSPWTLTGPALTQTSARHLLWLPSCRAPGLNASKIMWELSQQSSWTGALLPDPTTALGRQPSLVAHLSSLTIQRHAHRPSTFNVIGPSRCL